MESTKSDLQSSITVFGKYFINEISDCLTHELKVDLSKGVEAGKTLLVAALESKDKGAFMTVLRVARERSELLALSIFDQTRKAHWPLLYLVLKNKKSRWFDTEELEHARDYLGKDAVYRMSDGSLLLNTSDSRYGHRSMTSTFEEQVVKSQINEYNTMLSWALKSKETYRFDDLLQSMKECLGDRAVQNILMELRGTLLISAWENHGKTFFKHVLRTARSVLTEEQVDTLFTKHKDRLELFTKQMYGLELFTKQEDGLESMLSWALENKEADRFEDLLQSVKECLGDRAVQSMLMELPGTLLISAWENHGKTFFRHVLRTARSVLTEEQVDIVFTNHKYGLESMLSWALENKEADRFEDLLQSVEECLGDRAVKSMLMELPGILLISAWENHGKTFFEHVLRTARSILTEEQMNTLFTEQKDGVESMLSWAIKSKEASRFEDLLQSVEECLGDQAVKSMLMELPGTPLISARENHGKTFFEHVLRTAQRILTEEQVNTLFTEQKAGVESMLSWAIKNKEASRFEDLLQSVKECLGDQAVKSMLTRVSGILLVSAWENHGKTFFEHVLRTARSILTEEQLSLPMSSPRTDPDRASTTQNDQERQR